MSLMIVLDTFILDMVIEALRHPGRSLSLDGASVM